MRYYLFFLSILLLFPLSSGLIAQCNLSETPQSDRIANYNFDIRLNAEEKAVKGTELISWKNPSPDTIYNVELYLYLNAFKNASSSYLKGSSFAIMGQNLRSRTQETFGFIDIIELKQEGKELVDKSYFLQRDDGNIDDQSVLNVVLDKPVYPGEELTLELKFHAKLPKTIARSGYSRNNFHLFVHWYPKLGVYEKDEQGRWGWNCHQFLRQMEFYGEFGNYKMSLEAPADLVIGNSGCRLEEEDQGNGYKRYEILAQDVIDFAWCAYPDFKVLKTQWKHVEINLLYPPHHKRLTKRFMKAAIGALEFLEKHVGKYPYLTLTIMDPPAHAMRSGFMEYPTFITGGSFYGFPTGIRTLESLIIHELSHQYFMGILATNEKEAPWMDEGFVTFYEDLIMESIYGQEASLFDIFGYKVSNSELTRNEYTSLRNKGIDVINAKSWNIKSDYKATIYSKTATFLQTIKRHLGAEAFDEMMRSYFEKNKFKHPREEDFRKELILAFEKQSDNILTPSIAQFFNDCVTKPLVCDYRVRTINYLEMDKRYGWYDINGTRTFINELNQNSDTIINEIVVERKGTLVSPVEIELEFQDGSMEYLNWDGVDALKRFQIKSTQKLICAQIDPEQKLYLDIDLNNNSFKSDVSSIGAIKYSGRVLYWVQNILQGFSILM